MRIATLSLLSILYWRAFAVHESAVRRQFAFACIYSATVEAAILGAIDYKWTFSRAYDSDDDRIQAYSECHTRSAKRVLKALLANGGEYVNVICLFSQSMAF